MRQKKIGKRGNVGLLMACSGRAHAHARTRLVWPAVSLFVLLFFSFCVSKSCFSFRSLK
jgi:hypothetical protein